MKRAIFAGTIVLVSSVALAQQVNPLQERNDWMKSMWSDGMRPLSMIIRGQARYDKAKVQASLAALADAADKLPPLWPADSKPPQPPKTKFYSSAKVWENKSDFEAKLAAFAKAVADHRAQAEAGLEGLKVAYKAIDQACDSCHETYRVRAQ